MQYEGITLIGKFTVIIILHFHHHHHHHHHYYYCYRVYNKILDHDWFSAHLFVT